MVINANIAKKSGKERREKETNIIYIVVDNFGVVFIWSVHISKYGN